jgi:hypothetical protein
MLALGFILMRPLKEFSSMGSITASSTNFMVMPGTLSQATKRGLEHGNTRRETLGIGYDAVRRKYSISAY